jgi:hypothetical protein
MGTGSFPGVNRLGGGVDHPPPSTAELKSRAVPLLPLWAFVASSRLTFTFTWVVALRRLLVSYRSFGKTHWSHLQVSAIKCGTDRVSQKSVPNYQEVFQKWRRRGTGVYMREGTTSRVMVADRPYGEF